MPTNKKVKLKRANSKAVKQINIANIKKLDKALDKSIATHKPKISANYKALGANAKKQLPTYLSGHRKSIKLDNKTRKKLRGSLDSYFKDIEKQALKSVKGDLRRNTTDSKKRLDIINLQATKSTKGNAAWAKKLADKQAADYQKYIQKNIDKARKANPEITKAELDKLIDKKTQSFINSRASTTVQNEGNRIQNQVRIEAFKNSGMVQGVVFTAVLDNRTTQNCRDKNGTKLKLDDPRMSEYICPNHVNCRSYLVPIMIDEKFKPTSTAVINRHLLRFGKPKQPKGQPVYYTYRQAKYYLVLFKYDGLLFYEFEKEVA